MIVLTPGVFVKALPAYNLSFADKYTLAAKLDIVFPIYIDQGEGFNIPGLSAIPSRC